MEPAEVGVRAATFADARAVSSLFKEAFCEFRQFYTTEAYRATVLDEPAIIHQIKQSRVWVAEYGESIAGTLTAVWKPDCIMLRSMAVRPNARGLGVGRKLLQYAERFARDNSCGRLSLYTMRFLKPAIQLYLSAGFRFTDEVEMPHGVELLRMVKPLVAEESIDDSFT